MITHEELKVLALSDPAVWAEYERIEREEMPMFDVRWLKQQVAPDVAKRLNLFARLFHFFV